MKILQIASIFPVKDAPRVNPYVQNFVAHYMDTYRVELDIIKPASYLPAFLAAFTSKKEYWRNKRRLCRTKKYTFNNIEITVWPYMSVGSVSMFHSILSSYVFWLNRKKIKRLDHSQYDLMHAHFLFPDGMIAYQLNKRYGIPYILTMQQELRFLENKLSLKWVKKIISKASAVTTLSPQMAEGLKEKGIENVQLVPMGIEEYFFKDGCHIEGSESLRNEERRDLSAEQAGIPQNNGKSRGDSRLNDVVGQVSSLRSQPSSNSGGQAFEMTEAPGKLKLLSVCNLLPIKNLEVVIRAISSMPEKEQIDYTIYGTGPLEQKLKELVSELQLEQHIHFKGVIENKELPAVMPKFDVFIQPSFKETLGLSYFEALACGLPVILTENTGAYEMIKDKDVYYVVDPHEMESVANCLKGIINDPETLARKAALSPDVAKIASREGFVVFFHERYSKIAFNSEEIRRLV